MSGLALHPAQRRRLAAAMPRGPIHETVLRPLGGGPEAMIVTATEPSFIEAVLADAQSSGWRQALAARRGRRRGPDGSLELHQPVHRRFHLVLLEAACREPGQPRLDPKRLEGTGLVLRRVDGGGRQGWMSEGAVRRGWLALDDELQDPDPARRMGQRTGAAGRIEALVEARRVRPSRAEQVLPLFVAPPDVAATTGRTLLFGLLPVTSGERQETAPVAPDYRALPAAEAADMITHLSSYLKARPRLELPRPGQTLDPAWRPLDLEATGASEEGRLKSLGVFLQQLLVELGAFEEGPARAELLAALATIALPMAKDGAGRTTRTMSAADWVAGAAPVLVAGEANGAALAMPLEWPAIDTAPGARLTQAALACLGERHAALAPPPPKFDGDDRLYAVRAFIRVKGHADCPSRLVWSEESEPFRILPWWEGDGPATRIALPPLAEAKRLKPNVSFQLPPELANLLQGNMKKLKEGEGSTGGLGIFWLCSFSIPIITLCAFIVLNIFLALFDVIFRWLPFIKICLPIPRPK